MPKEQRAKAIRIEYLTHSVIEIEFEMVEPQTFSYLPGQFIMIYAGEHEGKKVKRAYSIFSPPLNPRRFWLGIKLIEWGLASHFFIHMKVGDEVAFTGPHGKFLLNEKAGKNIVGVATGTGLTPIYSIFTYFLEKGDRRQYRLLWGLRYGEDLHYDRQLEELARKHPNFSCTIFLSKPDADWKGTRGRVTDQLRRDFPGVADHDYFICGNGDMVKEVIQMLADRGVPKGQVHSEIFFTPS